MNAGHAFSVGSETSGGVVNVTFRDCTASETQAVAHIVIKKKKEICCFSLKRVLRKHRNNAEDTSRTFSIKELLAG